jgi:hypothetical protein
MFNRHLFISNKKKELLLNFDTSSRFAFLWLAVKDHAHMHGYNVKENKQVWEDTSFKIESNKYWIETGLV